VENNEQVPMSQSQISTSEDSVGTTSSKIIILLFWLLLAVNMGLLFYYFPNIPQWRYENSFKINGFTLLIWTTVTFFSALVGTYAGNYLKGFKYRSKFMVLCLFFTLSVMLFVASEHILPLLLSWLAMGLIMSRLIGIDARWGEAREAATFT